MSGNLDLKCLRCETVWVTRDLVIDRKEVQCPVCGEPNDIQHAAERAKP